MCNDFTLSVPLKHRNLNYYQKSTLSGNLIQLWKMDHGPFSSMIFPLKPAFASRISKHWHQRANPIRRKFKSQLNLLNNIIEINCFCYLFKFIIHEFTYQSKIQSNKQIPVSQVNFHTYHFWGDRYTPTEQLRSPTPKRT